MRRLIIRILLTISIVTIISCDTVDSSEPADVTGEWLIPENQVFDGGPGKDGIPALTDPEVVSISEISYLNDDDLVLIYNRGNEVRIYPHPILDWHEIINDKINGKAIAITYCPLTGSGIAWDRTIDGAETTFGVSGLLYNSNLIPYDRKTGSNWSQMRIQSINGPLISTIVNTNPLVETSWETAKAFYPTANVVTENTGYSRNYGRYPYGSYKTSNSLFVFPVNHEDNRLDAKERVLGVFGKTTHKAYRISDFNNRPLVIDKIDSEKYLIYGKTSNNFLVAFKLTNRMIDLDFKKSNSEPPFILEDKNGTKYDLFGKSNNIEVEDLLPTNSFMAYWFAWAAFYPETELFEY